MAGKINPIKRSKQLAPLSRDHHEGLLLVWKIRQGLKNKDDIKVIAEFVQVFWKTHLMKHFHKEEVVLGSHLPGDNALLKRMIEEHRDIEALIMINEKITVA